MSNNTITFEVGDLVYCAYYGQKGFITEIKPNNNGDNQLDHIILVNKDKQRFVTKVMTDSSNSVHPVYLQLIMKKADVDNIVNRTLFG